ncbi:MAG: serine/threonine protein kinase [Candidatus Eremiobacteraeota bacterium]|nr:serine/threonine protein kinase [Candidatus Eremiobacteraeota bacterium]
MLAAGAVLEDRYQIERKLGEGGMGCVYLATHLRLKKQFAVKSLLVLSDDPVEQRQYLEQFEAEAQMLASLEHPSLAGVSDFFEAEGVHYLVMEFIDGKTLTKVVELAPKNISQRRVLQWTNELLDVLEYLHGSNPPVIVRDLKPDNIMLNRDGNLKLIDFGIAKQMGPGKQTRAIVKGMGTAEYAPLEQYGQGSTDQRSDIYALGATLYFLLTGQPPPPAWKRASEGVAVPDPRPLNPSVTEVFWRALQAMLELSRDNRPADVREVRALLAGQGVAKTPPPVRPTSSYGLPASQIAQPKTKVEPVVRVNSKTLNLRLTSGEKLQRYAAPIHSLAFSPTHGVLAVGSTFVHLWDLASRKLWQKVWRGTGSYNCSVAFSSDGRWLAVGSHDATVRIFEVRTGKMLRTLALRKVAFITDKVRDVGFAYGSRLVGAVSDLSNLRVWDSTNGRERYQKAWHTTGLLSHFQAKSTSLAFSSANHLAVGGSDGTITLYEASSGERLERIEGHSDEVSSLAFSKDGTFLASASMDGSAALWKIPELTELRRFTHPSIVYSVCFSHDGRLLASGAGDCAIRLWDVALGTEVHQIREHTGAVFAVAFSSVRGFLASGSNDRTVRLWNLSW